jgi:Raf kinase inhibitor-like YbhB/YbcL family protein
MPVSPLIQWSNVPEGTRSFVLHFHDPDAALNRTTNDQVHWLVWNIPDTAASLAENQPQGATLPDGSRQISASGQIYRGPGARAGGPRHHYTFELYALDTVLDVQHAANEQETRVNVLRAMQGHVLGKAVYVGLFRRPQ